MYTCDTKEIETRSTANDRTKRIFYITLDPPRYSTNMR